MMSTPSVRFCFTFPKSTSTILNSCSKWLKKDLPSFCFLCYQYWFNWFSHLVRHLVAFLLECFAQIEFIIVLGVVCLQLCHQNYMSRGEFHPGGLDTTREGTFMVYTLITHLLLLGCHPRRFMQIVFNKLSCKCIKKQKINIVKHV